MPCGHHHGSTSVVTFLRLYIPATKRRRRKFEPRVRVWKLKEEKTCEEFRCMVGDR